MALNHPQALVRRRRNRIPRMEKVVAGVVVVAVVGAGLMFAVGEGLIHWGGKKQSAQSVESGVAVPADPGPPARKAVEAFFEAADLDGMAAASRDGSRV